MQYAMENGIVDVAGIEKLIEMKKREEYLSRHPYKIWQGKDGKWRTHLPKKDNPKERKLVKKSSYKAVEDAVIDYWSEDDLNPTIREVFEEWNDRRVMLEQISKSTHYRNIQYFDRHFKEFGEKRIKNVDPEEISEFLEEQIPQYQMSSKGFNNLKTIVRGFLKRAKKRKIISYNVEGLFQELDVSEVSFKRKVKDDNKEVFDEKETDAMLGYLLSNLDSKNLGILLLFITGIRVGELVALKHEDLTENSVLIRRTETRYLNDKGRSVYDVRDFPKTVAGVREVVIPSDFVWVIDTLHKYNPNGEYIFVGRTGNRLITCAFRKRLYKICKQLNITPKSPHKIRKTYGSILLDNGIDHKFVIDQMGHTDVSCTEGHYHRTRRSIDHKQSIISAIPEFNNWSNSVGA